MENENRETSTPAAAERDNVVQLPRDWLGPREELVPFGPRADKHAAVEPDAALVADDFWGENSSSLQGAVRSPEDPVDAATPAQSTEEAPRGRRRHLAVPALALVVVVLAVAFVIGRALGSHGGAHVTAAGTSTPTVLLAGLTPTDQSVSAEVAQLGSRRLAVPARPRPKRAPHRHASPVHHHSTPSAAPESAGTTESTVVNEPSAGSGYSGSTGTTSTAGGSSGTSSGSSSASSSSSSKSQPAFGASGTLGPGSSPNG